MSGEHERFSAHSLRSKEQELPTISELILRYRWPSVAIVGVTALVLAGCGSASGPSSSKVEPSSATELRINRERTEAAESAHQEDKLKALEREVRRLRHHGAQHTTTVVERASGTSGPVSTAASAEARVFHAPSGNVTCEVHGAGARCSVASNNQTFVLPEGGPAYIESGLTLSAGSGPLAEYGTSVGDGSVRCVIPLQSEPKGITCSSSESGHGFEASRVFSRQEAY
jgi:hypothetical protein